MLRFDRNSRMLLVCCLVSLLFAVGLFFFGPSTAVAQSGIVTNLDFGAELTDPTADPASAEDQVAGIISTIVNLFSLVVGVVAVIMIIIGGLKYITSGGDSGNVTGAKNTILYAIIGLVVVALSQVIVRFVIEQIGGQ